MTLRGRFFKILVQFSVILSVIEVLSNLSRFHILNRQPNVLLMSESDGFQISFILPLGTYRN